MRKLTPKKFTPEQLEAVKVESANQSTSTVVEKTTDPNYPMFDIPVNDKVLIYVPNHTVVDKETGVVSLRMDKPILHPVKKGKRFLNIRCVRGLSEAAGYSGECPFCNGEQDPWTLANEQIKEQCKQRGLDPADSDSEEVKAIKRECYSNRVVKAGEQYYTFPIVVIETDPANFKTILFDEKSGIPKHRVCWYTIKKSSYENKWGKTLEGMEDEPTHPGGEFFILNFTYESKQGDWNKRDSARALAVTHKRVKDSQKAKEYFDKETADWDVAKAIETIYDNMFYTEEDLQAEVDEVLQPTRDKIALYKSQANAALLTSKPAFQLGAPAGDGLASDGIGGVPMADVDDED